eukprot:TRINITY_DN226_c0_g1_i1.p1 TRINITY_DN226_c0_g1~~TRINITY_DN226_c0_g1_i1.p1  ORF type:complete len:425 (-),score=50.23 TRINITY_DN226_c0_g1_i1:64-1248(-)
MMKSITSSLLARSVLFLAFVCVTMVMHHVSALPPLNMDGPMTGPGQVRWDSDLGVPLVWNGGNYFMEGDSMIGGNHGTRVAGNAIGGCKPLPCKVIWYLNGQGDPIMYIAWPPKVISCVPAGACEANGNAYIWHMNVVDWGNGSPGSVAAWSMLLRGTPNPVQFVASPTLYFEVNSKFVNANMVVTNGTVFIYGTGLYRASPVYVAMVPAPQIENKGAWRYWTGSSWGEGENVAAPIISTKSGEISAIYSAYFKQFVVSAFDFSGVPTCYMWRSHTPTGPWSRSVIYTDLEPYPWKAGLSGPYGGYLVPDQGNPQPRMFMTFSFWVPYRTYMIETDLSKIGTGEPIFINAYDLKTGIQLTADTPKTHPYLHYKIDTSVRNDLWSRTNQTLAVDN